MRLSILNYGFDLGAEVPKYAVKEDEDILKIVEEIVTKNNFGRGGLIVSEVMHTGLTNFNNRKYMEKGMEASVKTFYYPHPTPFLLHHDSGEYGTPVIAVGSNIHSEFIKRRVDTVTGPASGYVKVATFIPETMMLGNQKAIDILRSRQIYSLSIGARVSDENYVCSICGKSVYDEECDHIPGRMYEGKKCEAHVYNPLFREYSAVYNPSDINAVIRRMDVLEGEGSEDAKDFNVDSILPNTGYAHIYENIGSHCVNLGEANTKDKAGKGMGDQTKDNAENVSELSILVGQYAKKAEESESACKTLATELSKQLSAVDSAKEETKAVSAELGSAKESITKLEAENGELKAKIATLEKELSDAKAAQNTDQKGKDDPNKAEGEKTPPAGDPSKKESGKGEGESDPAAPSGSKEPAKDSVKDSKQILDKVLGSVSVLG